MSDAWKSLMVVGNSPDVVRGYYMRPLQGRGVWLINASEASINRQPSTNNYKTCVNRSGSSISKAKLVRVSRAFLMRAELVLTETSIQSR